MDREANRSLKVQLESLSFTLFHILREFGRGGNSGMRLADFHKASYLIHKSVGKTLGVNTGLPWHWDLTGPVVVLDRCPAGLFTIEGYPGKELVVLHRKRSVTEVLPSSEKKGILDVDRKGLEKLCEDCRPGYLCKETALTVYCLESIF